MPPNQQDDEGLVDVVRSSISHGDTNNEDTNAKDDTNDDDQSSCSSPPSFKKSLWNRDDEHSACGVGFIVHTRAVCSNDLLKKAQVMSSRMEHRGACSCDNLTGDGAGVMTSMPVKLFQKRLQEAGVATDQVFASGLVFLEESTSLEVEAIFESLASKQGFKVIAWSRPPVDASCLGSLALGSQPFIKQVFVVDSRGKDKEQEIQFDDNKVSFEERLFFLRKCATHLLLEKGLRFYACSLSSKTFVYKGQFTPQQLWRYYLDLQDPEYECFLALVHARFSTNTFPNWDRAQPLRLLAHNGEINTLRGNVNNMRAREGIMSSDKFGHKFLPMLYPVVEADSSDSGSVDNVLEFLVRAGSSRSLPEAMITMVPEAVSDDVADDVITDKEAFFKWASLRMEAWDGPALFTFSDGEVVGAILDRNGLRPSRYVQTRDGLVIMASEVGVVDFVSGDVITEDYGDFEDFETPSPQPTTRGIHVRDINHFGRLRPGRILLVDTRKGLLIRDDDIKRDIFSKRLGVKDDVFDLDHLLSRAEGEGKEEDAVAMETTTTSSSNEADPRLLLYSYSTETLDMLLAPMTGDDKKEALGSMGNDSALACLSLFQPLLYDYFKQVFAQVTNPPIDPFREKVVMSLGCPVGPEPNLLDPDSPAKRLWLHQPILSNRDMRRINKSSLMSHSWTSLSIDCTFSLEDQEDEEAALRSALERICAEAVAASKSGHQIIVLSDRLAGFSRIPIPALLSLGSVHQSLIQSRERNRVALFVETGEAREIHHLALLLGFGADAINPYLVFETMSKRKKGSSEESIFDSYRRAVKTGLLKVMAKMGISSLQSYKGAQIFEAVGLSRDVIDVAFSSTASRVGGASFGDIAREAVERHSLAFRLDRDCWSGARNPGLLHWRAGGEAHVNEPMAVALLQEAAKSNSIQAYHKYVEWSREACRKTTLRGQLKIKYPSEGIAVEDVTDSVTDIMRRFCTGAMSYGSISKEAHEALAVAMNRIGGKSNTGEGGESAERYSDPATRSSIKQVASGRFGVTAAYLANADELQIKMAQGAKPGEGGELPGHKVTAEIAAVRMSVPGVGLISPPPHHDIYSIEDLAQLIYDLKAANPEARISVKLVSVVGVGVVAAGVAKGKAEHITISGHDGGTGASSWTGIKGAGIPWELGLSETHQVLVANDLRSRVVLQVDGQLRTAFDVIVGACLGAEEFAFSTAPLIVLGCTMMRKCHLNTCPVGVATQDPVLRAKFAGETDHVVTFFYLLAQEIREEMARLGVRSFDQLVGRSDFLAFDPIHAKAARLDLEAVLCKTHWDRKGGREKQAFDLDKRLDQRVIERARAGGLFDQEERETHMVLRLRIRNTDRAFGTTLSHCVVKAFGEKGFPPNKTLTLMLRGSAGQSFAAWLCSGLKVVLEGEANDYVGKGLSGGRVVVFPPRVLTEGCSEDGHVFRSENNILVGNVCLYGATSGACFLRGLAGERFCVRNSGATAVVEGVGDHGCEYMTGGEVVVLGDTGRNFGAGMSGGVAWVYTFPPYNLLRDRKELQEAKELVDSLQDSEDILQQLESRFKKDFSARVNCEQVDLYSMDGDLFCGDDLSPKKGGVFPGEEDHLKDLLQEFVDETSSIVASTLLQDWTRSRRFFLKVFPRDFHRVMAEKVAAKEVAAQEVMEVNDNKIDNNKIDDDNNDKTKDIEDLVVDKVRGFLKYPRIKGYLRPVGQRLDDYKEVYDTEKMRRESRIQASRCMDCGIPFCQSSTTGCPLNNQIPAFNDSVSKGDLPSALHTLLQTNNFPEFTGRVCPAPCEGSCVLGINSDPVAIKSVELSISEFGFQSGMIAHLLAQKHASGNRRSGFSVAIVGSGPAGLAAAAQLALAGHGVTVFEREEREGGLLRYGIPNMKLDKEGVLDRRINLMTSVQGVVFETGVDVGSPSFPVSRLDAFDAVGVCVGATWPRDLPIPGRATLKGIYFAMEYLSRGGESSSYVGSFSASGKKVLVIGGGDTGCDCIATALREGALDVTALEILPQPPPSRADDNPWPQWPKVFRLDYGHEEVKARFNKDPRLFCMSAREFVGDSEGNVVGVKAVRVEWTRNGQGGWKMTEVEDSTLVIPCDLVLLAMGFLGPQKYLPSALGLEVDARSNNILVSGGDKRPHFLDDSSRPFHAKDNIFLSGDCRRGQSLVVHAINEGRQMARAIDLYFKRKGTRIESSLSCVGGIVLPESKKEASPLKAAA